MRINLFNDVGKFKLRRKKKHIEWIAKISKNLGLDKEGGINIILVGRNTILKINREFLGHNYLTDVISFKYEEDSEIFGEIYICPYQVNQNAKRFNVSFEDELRRVIAHGMLHLSGYNDGTDKEREEMRRMEDSMLDLWS